MIARDFIDTNILVYAYEDTAERGGCKRLWSEDFNAGQKYFGITGQNPFV